MTATKPTADSIVRKLQIMIWLLIACLSASTVSLALSCSLMWTAVKWQAAARNMAHGMQQAMSETATLDLAEQRRQAEDMEKAAARMRESITQLGRQSE